MNDNKNNEDNINKEGDINSDINSEVENLTFGCSTSSYQKPKINVINSDSSRIKNYSKKNNSNENQEINQNKNDNQDLKNFFDLNSIKDSLSLKSKNDKVVNKSLIDLIYGKNYNPETDDSTIKENKNLTQMFEELKDEINDNKRRNKILYSDFVNILDSKNIKNKHVCIHPRNPNEGSKEKLYIYNNKKIIGYDKNVKKKSIFENEKYFYINNNQNINQKVHVSNIFVKKGK